MEQLTYSVEEVAAMLGISRGKAYEHARCADFPVIRMGRRLLVPRDRFHAWLSGEQTSAPCEVA